MYSCLHVLMSTGDYDELVSGGAKGPDTIAREFAEEYGYKILEIFPDWDKHGRAAGFIRNKDIWDEAVAGVAFWDGVSKGTAHSFELAKKQNKPIFVFNGNMPYDPYI